MENEKFTGFQRRVAPPAFHRLLELVVRSVFCDLMRDPRTADLNIDEREISAVVPSVLADVDFHYQALLRLAHDFPRFRAYIGVEVLLCWRAKLKESRSTPIDDGGEFAARTRLVAMLQVASLTEIQEDLAHAIYDFGLSIDQAAVVFGIPLDQAQREMSAIRRELCRYARIRPARLQRPGES